MRGNTPVMHDPRADKPAGPHAGAPGGLSEQRRRQKEQNSDPSRDAADTRETAEEPLNEEPQLVVLSDREEETVKRTVAPRAAVLFEAIRREGANELARPALGLAFSALAAGGAMGFSLVATGVLAAYLPAGAPWRVLVENLGYTVGFLIVVLGRQQLFTENTVTAILPVLDNPNHGQRLFQVGRLWGIVLIGNLAGATAFAYTVAFTNVFPPPVQAAFLEIGRHAADASFQTIMMRGIFAGWLIALMVWLLPAAENSHVAVIGIITYLVGVAGLSHIIAGSVEVLYTVAVGDRSWLEYFTGFLVPVFIGNSIGGIALVSLLNYGQVAPGG